MIENDDVENTIARSQAVIGLLDRSAREQRADLAGARAVEPRHAAAVRRFVAERSAPRRTRGALLLLGTGLAAAAALALWLAPWRTSDTPPGSEVHLGGGAGALRVEAESVAWDFTLGAGGWFVVVVRDAAGAELARSPALTATYWPISADQRAAWGSAATFEVEVRDGTGRLESTLR